MVVSAHARGLAFGCGINGPGLRDSALLAAHVRESGMCVPIGEGAWAQTHPGPAQWDFAVMDRMQVPAWQACASTSAKKL